MELHTLTFNIPFESEGLFVSLVVITVYMMDSNFKLIYTSLSTLFKNKRLKSKYR